MAGQGDIRNGHRGSRRRPDPHGKRRSLRHAAHGRHDKRSAAPRRGGMAAALRRFLLCARLSCGGHTLLCISLLRCGTHRKGRRDTPELSFPHPPRSVGDPYLLHHCGAFISLSADARQRPDAHLAARSDRVRGVRHRLPCDSRMGARFACGAHKSGQMVAQHADIHDTLSHAACRARRIRSCGEAVPQASVHMALGRRSPCVRAA